MTGNIHLWGQSVTDLMRPEVANHDVAMTRNEVTIGPFSASSGPVGQELLTELGIDISTKSRSFKFKSTSTESHGEPQIGDIITDLSDDTTWRILPQGRNYAWRWHGQHRTNYSVITEQDD